VVLWFGVVISGSAGLSVVFICSRSNEV
jgi:hypothetical protein